jgi:hypothetical protein
MVRVRDPKGKPYQAGINSLAKALERRVRTEEAFAQPAEIVRELILSSGGYIRDLLRLVRECIMFCPSQPDELITGQVLERAVTRVQNVYREGLLEEQKDVLAKAHRLKDYPLSSGNLNLFGDLIRSHMLLRYHNKREWYDVHPLLWEFLPRPRKTKSKSA